MSHALGHIQIKTHVVCYMCKCYNIMSEHTCWNCRPIENVNAPDDLEELPDHTSADSTVASKHQTHVDSGPWILELCCETNTARCRPHQEKQREMYLDCSEIMLLYD